MERNIVRLAGVLLITQMVTAITSYSIIVEPVLFGSGNYLNEVAQNTHAMRIAALLDFMTTLIYFGFAVLLFPILKRHSERIAIWYTGIKLSEFVTLTLSGIFLLAILSVARDYITPEPSESPILQTLGDHMVNARIHTQNLNLLAYCFGTYLFHYLLYTTRLVPRFIAIWGFIGVTGLLTEILLSIFGLSSGALVYILGMPLGLNEIFLGIWLIVRGFNPKAMSHQSKNLQSECQ